MRIKKLFQYFTIIIFLAFFTHYYHKSSNLVIQVQGDVPHGELKEQWDHQVTTVILSNPLNAQRALELWLKERAIYGRVFLHRSSSGHMTIHIDLNPFDFVINNRKCIRKDGLFSNYPCFLNEESTGFIDAPEYIEKKIIYEKKYLKSLSRLKGGFSIYFSPFGFVDFINDDLHSCRLSLSYDLTPQIMVCITERDLDSNVKFLDFTLSDNILAFR